MNNVKNVILCKLLLCFILYFLHYIRSTGIEPKPRGYCYSISVTDRVIKLILPSTYFMLCSLVLAISTGMEAMVVTRPENIEAKKWQKIPSYKYKVFLGCM